MLATEGLTDDAAAIGLSRRGATAPTGASANELRSPSVRRSSSSRGKYPAFVMAIGLLVTAVASMTLLHGGAPASGGAGARTHSPVPTPSPSSVVIGGPSDVAAQIATYPPGQSSGWHAHTGLHAVVVLAGTLTIVDGGCQRRTYGPGESYVGGRDVHVALNETAAPLEMAVTYMFPAGVSHTGFHAPAAVPAGCETR